MNFHDQIQLVPVYLAAHLQLTLLALTLGILISLPLGLAAVRVASLEKLILSLAGIIQTIPSLALLAVIVPLLAGLKLPSIGFLPALIGLTLYSLLPILRNTVTGLRGVDPACIEAAVGVGMDSRQKLFKVELPLAMPVIIAGIRTAAVWTVGMATLSTPIGAPSLGNFIFTGLQTRNYASVITGSAVAAALALAIDGLIRLVENGLQERKRQELVPAAAIGVVLVGLALWPLLSRSAGKPVITIGAKTFTEQYILAEVMAQKIKADTGSNTRVLSSLGSVVAFDALKRNEIDAYVDYSGTIWNTVLKRLDMPSDRRQMLSELQWVLHKSYGTEIVAFLGFENTYALAMPRKKAEEFGIKTIGDLRNHSEKMTIGSDYEFLGRPEWKAVTSAYGISFGQSRSMDPSLMYQAVANGSVDVISAFSTDGRIAAYDLVILEDTKSAIPPYDAIVLFNWSSWDKLAPQVRSLKALDGTITPELMRKMNMQVDMNHEQPADVAREFLKDLGKKK